jgi:hypothetical protein
MTDAADEINKAEARKRFLNNLDRMTTKVALSEIAGKIFDIQDFQGTQNHMSTETRKMMGRQAKAIYVIAAAFSAHFVQGIAPSVAPYLDRLIQAIAPLLHP